jgi:hypothetical protein
MQAFREEHLMSHFSDLHLRLQEAVLNPRLVVAAAPTCGSCQQKQRLVDFDGRHLDWACDTPICVEIARRAARIVNLSPELRDQEMRRELTLLGEHDDGHHVGRPHIDCAACAVEEGWI